MDDREWMYRRMRNGRMNPEYITGVRRFINFAYSIGRNVSLGKIRCPCVKCRNQKFQKEDDVSYHLLRKEFLPYYKNWTVHGEPYDTDNMVGPSSGGISRVVNGEGDNRSKIVVEKYRNEMVARYGPDQDNHPSFDGAAWCEASGGVSKGRVYGAPRMPKSKVDVSSSSHTYSVNSSYPSTTTTRRYEEQLQQNCEAIDDMRNEMSSIKDYLKLLVGHMGLSMSTPMAPSMPSPVAPSMPSPLAPSMPSPTMAPGHRPRPRPRPQMPYNGPSSSHQQHRRSFPP